MCSSWTSSHIYAYERVLELESWRVVEGCKRLSLELLAGMLQFSDRQTLINDKLTYIYSSSPSLHGRPGVIMMMTWHVAKMHDGALPPCSCSCSCNCHAHASSAHREPTCKSVVACLMLASFACFPNS
jgi:hypothetical protein